MKSCCKNAIRNYKRNKALSEFKKILPYCDDFKTLGKEGRSFMLAFIDGMKN